MTTRLRCQVECEGRRMATYWKVNLRGNKRTDGQRPDPPNPVVQRELPPQHCSALIRPDHQPLPGTMDGKCRHHTPHHAGCANSHRDLALHHLTNWATALQLGGRHSVGPPSRSLQAADAHGTTLARHAADRTDLCPTQCRLSNAVRTPQTILLTESVRTTKSRCRQWPSPCGGIHHGATPSDAPRDWAGAASPWRPVPVTPPISPHRTKRRHCCSTCGRPRRRE